MRPVIVYRNDVDWRYEQEVAKNYFPCFGSRLNVQKDDLVIARFSALPFFKEQYNDYCALGATMINNTMEHSYIADLQNWYFDLQDFTPRTWNDLYSLPEEGPFILKGETNSKKFLWNTHMFAKNKKEAIEIHTKLTNDSMLQYQKIYIRKFEKLKTYMDAIQGLPITKEFRFFFYKKQLLSGGFYWSSHIEDLKYKGFEIPSPDEVPRNFLEKIASIVGEMTNYWVVDIAQKEDGEWIVIELNDGTMSGLSDNDPDILYRNLKECLK